MTKIRSAAIMASTVDSSPVGASVPSTGAFTALVAASLALPGVHDAANGTIPLPNGWFLKWAKGSSVNGRGQLSVNWDTAFPNECVAVLTTVVFDNPVSSANWQGAAFYVQPGTNKTSVGLQYDVRSDGSADTTYHPMVFGLGR
jgi:hypothetical protein